jgi:acyl carrier protein
MIQNNENLTQNIIELLKKNVPGIAGFDILHDTPLITTGLLDSFNLIEFLSVLQSHYSVTFDVENLDFSDFEYPASIAKIVHQYMLK